MAADRPDTNPRDTGSAPSFAELVYFQLAAGMIVFGSATPVSKIVTEAMPVFIGSLFRVGLGALVLAPAAWMARDDLRQLGRRDWVLVSLIALFGMFGFTAFMLYGMRLIPGVTGAIVMATTPAVTAIAAVMFLGEAVTWRKLAALVLAVAGVVLLHATGEAGGEGSAAGSFFGPAIWGAVLVFAAVCCEAAYTLLGRRMSRQFDPRLVAFLAAALSVPIFVAGSLWQWGGFTPAEVGWAGWSAVIWYGAGTLALGSWLWYAGVAKTEGSVAAGFMALMPVSALVLSYVLLGEEFRVVHLLGFATVFAGVLLMSWEHARMSDEA